MKIKSGELEILYSGTVIAVANDPLIFEFPKKDSSLRFIFHFIDDVINKNSEVRSNVIDTRTLEVLFVNFSSATGTGNTGIEDIGYLGNRKLFFNYRVYAIEGISNTLHYTFYLGKEGSYVGK